ncbi:hypothetical protein NUU61_006404 [Penicillium alfredii]|uniref:Synaptobrevin n=1 Tax=Penicillium alfredii TaxID=1506179 RepID=A0A9W9F0U7_9EURO|nr:uncharacterized protein NUU61_006404 [Penicillium alfredii]KAJ5091534.1 hypothetical protein NUU61_006404 [Penicillium alfredii]
MTVTAFPSETSSDFTLLNVARLFTRLEHNLLAPGAEVSFRSEYQRMRVTKNVEYARTLLTQLERSLPQLKPLDRKHEAQTEIARDRQLLKRMQSLLEEADSRGAEPELDDEDEDDGDGEWRELLARPIAKEKVMSGSPTTQQDQKSRAHIGDDIKGSEASGTRDVDTTASTTTTTTTPSTTTTTTTPTATATATSTATTTSSTLRNRHTPHDQPTPNPTATTTATGSNTSSTPHEPNTKLGSTEQALSTQRLEQEDLTSSLLSLASQLKASSHSFQSTLDGEKSVLDRAVHGIDRTSATMEAAGQRMGMLRRMTEGKGWWGRMMLYGWIFGLWVVAVLIVFLGPKLRF